MVARAIARARERGKPHNVARVTFVKTVLAELTRTWAQQLKGQGNTVDESDFAMLREDLRTAQDVRVALNTAWMPLTPQKLVQDLYARPRWLAELTPRLERRSNAPCCAATGRAPFTVSDVPLLDEAAELLGEFDDLGAARGREARAQRRRDVENAERAIENMGVEGIVSARALAAGFAEVADRGTTAERAAADRTWAYGHIVVDEAQELSADAVAAAVPALPAPLVHHRRRHRPGRIRLRRRDLGGCARAAARGTRPGRRGHRMATGDSHRQLPHTQPDRHGGGCDGRRARAAGHPGDLGAGERLADRRGARRPAASGRRAARRRSWTRCARTAPWMRRAPWPSSPGSTRWRTSSTRCPRTRQLDVGRGSEGLTRPIVVLSPQDAKGLEFDAVVIVDPAGIVDATARGAAALYVAMTRPTQRLTLVTPGELPAGLGV